MWNYTTPAGEELNAEPVFNAAQNEIALVGIDLLFVRLDAATGELKWKADTLGRAGFTDIAAYGNGYLVHVDMSGYRENEKGLGRKKPTPDQLYYWGESEKDGWSIDFPIGADLLVDGKVIYAVRHIRGEVRLRVMHPPAVR
jgi:hypothetical protein